MMGPNEQCGGTIRTRRAFIHSTSAAFAAALFSATRALAAEGRSHGDEETNLAFAAHENEYQFDTGLLRGKLRADGKSLGLMPLVDCVTGTTIARGAGVFSHYRILDAENRYGHAAWDWPSRSKLLPCGALEVLWSADESHPFDMRAVYRWAAANTLDVTTSVVPQKDVQRFEVFLASYFGGFPVSRVWVKNCPNNGGRPGFMEAKKSAAVWQMFPRDEEAATIIVDGRWQRPPHPVSWRIMPTMAAPLAMRRDAETGLTGLVMAPAEDCFAVSTPYGEEGHRSLYLSLLGCDIPAGQTATARSRLVIGREISDEGATAFYKRYIKEIGRQENGSG